MIIGAGGFGLAAAQALISGAGIEGSEITIIGRHKTLRECGEASGLGSGLVGQVRHSAGAMRLLKEAAEGLAALHGRTAQIHHHHRHKEQHQHGHHFQEDSDYHGLEWHQSGSLRLGDSAQETEQLLRHAKEAGLEVQVLHKPEVHKKFPQLVLKGHQSALWCPSDGYFTPAALSKAYERLLQAAGVKVALDTEVQGLELHHHSNRVAAVRTDKGSVECEYVINAAELQSYQVGRLAGLELPVFPVLHRYVVTEKIEELALQHQLPCFRLPHLGAYGRVTQGGGLLLGGFSSDPTVVDPHSQHGGHLPGSADDLQELRKSLSPHLALARPVDRYNIERSGTTWHTFVPDGKPIIGESSKVPGFVIMAGCNGHGASCAPGFAEALVQTLFDKQSTSEYLQHLSPNRFLDDATPLSARHWPHLLARTRETSSSYYQSEH